MAKKQDFLATFMGSPARAKVLRLFVFNEEESLTIDEIVKRAQVTKAAARKEMTFFRKVGLVKECSVFRTEIKTKRGKPVTKKIRVKAWTVNSRFEYIRSLHIFIRDTSPVPRDTIAGKLRGAGKLKLVVASGTFVDDNPMDRIDLLVVADNMNERNLQKALRGLESELGRELRYAAFPTEEFKYRMNVYDKLVRDVFDYPHLVLLDRLGVAL
jgi:hypothetical protein